MSLTTWRIKWEGRNPIAQARRHRGMNRLRAAQAIRCSATAIEHWEAGVSNPFSRRSKHQRRIAEFCGMTVDQVSKVWKVWIEEKEEYMAKWGMDYLDRHPEAVERVALGQERIYDPIEGAQQKAEAEFKAKPLNARLNSGRKAEDDATAEWQTKNFLVRWRIRWGLSRQGLADELNEKGTTASINPSSLGYVTASVIRSWENGKAAPWRHDGGKTWQHLVTYIGVEEDMLRGVWDAWLASNPSLSVDTRDDKLYAVTRRAVLMEDEGHEQIVSTFRSREAAEHWIEEQVDEYFKPTDYYITEVPAPQ